MATLAIPLIGAAAGGLGAWGAFGAAVTFTQVAAGIGLGLTAGGIINNLVNPQVIEGARLGDKTVTASTYGAVQPVIYGRIAVGGNLIWARAIEERRSERKAGGKGGPVQVSYSYYGTFAIDLCEGPMATVVRIWADTKLIFDASAGTDTIRSPGVQFRFYPGNETQLPDSIIEADKGVGEVPAYRGSCYLVFDSLPLADYGNRIPNIRAEVAAAADTAFDYEHLDTTGTIFALPFTDDGIAIDPWQRRGFSYADTGGGATGISVFDLDTMTIQNEALMTAITGAGTDKGFYDYLFFGPDEHLYVEYVDGGSQEYLARVDPNTLTVTATFPVDLFASPGTASEYAFKTLCFNSYYDTLTGTRVDSLLVLGFSGDVGLLTLPLMLNPSGTIPAATLSGGNTYGSCRGLVGIGAGESWASSASGVTRYIDKIEIIGDLPVVTNLYSFTFTDMDATAVAFFSGSVLETLVYDEADNSLLFEIALELPGSIRSDRLVKWSEDSGVIFNIEMVGPLSRATVAGSISSGTYARLSFNGGSGEYVTLYDSSTGAVKTSDLWPIHAPANSVAVYDDLNQLILASVYSSAPPVKWTKLRVGRVDPATTTLGAIYLDQCERAGFEAADIDTTDLIDVVTGFAVTQRATVIDTLAPLSRAYLVDAIEEDWLLQFRHRGAATVLDLTEDDPIRPSGSETAEPYTAARRQEIELPMNASMTFIDLDRDYQENTVSAKRMRYPNPTVYSDNQDDLGLPVVMQATAAQRILDKLFYSAWNERDTFDMRLPQTFSYLTPADPVTFTLADGRQYRCRIGKCDVGADFTLAVQLLVESATQFESLATADAGTPWPGSHSVLAPILSRLTLLDTPLLRDVDDLGGRSIRAYWAGGSNKRDGTWTGGLLQMSVDTSAWDTIDTADTEATWGIVETAPADPSSCFHTQLDGTLTVRVIGGQYDPTTISDLELLNLGNPMALIKSNGEVEVLQFRDVTDHGSGRYTLSVLLRGRRGTDTMATGHANGERFVFLTETTINDMALPLTERAASEYWRLVTNGMLAGTAQIISGVFNARDQMPYAPVDVDATLNGSDIDLTWVRRTRIGGDLMDGTGTVPLHETSEAYEVDILDGPGGTVVHTLTGLTTAAATYAAADIAADLGSTPSTLYCNVYQLSGIVGRGFSYEWALEVA